MMCAHLLKRARDSTAGFIRRASGSSTGSSNTYGADAVAWCCGIRPITLVVLLATIGLNVYLYIRVPKGFFPQQDNGTHDGRHHQADQDTSFQAMEQHSAADGQHREGGPGRRYRHRVHGRQRRRRTTNTARMFISLEAARASARSPWIRSLQRLRPKLAAVPGATLYLQASQDVRVGGRQSNALYQFTMQGDNLPDLTTYVPADARTN